MSRTAPLQLPSFVTADAPEVRLRVEQQQQQRGSIRKTRRSDGTRSAVEPSDSSAGADAPPPDNEQHIALKQFAAGLVAPRRVVRHACRVCECV
jgi:hypothetical protein